VVRAAERTDGARSRKGTDQVLGHNEVSQAKAGRERFTERSNVEDPFPVIETLQRRQRPGIKIIFAVVVVF